MTDLDALQADPFWQGALVLGKQLMHLGYGCRFRSSAQANGRMLELATRIPRLVGEAHLSEDPGRRDMFLADAHAALDEVQRLLAEESRHEDAVQVGVEDAFVCADGLREKIGLARQRGEFLCLSA